jgi:Ig-like domain from next to BRCA1 gene
MTGVSTLKTPAAVLFRTAVLLAMAMVAAQMSPAPAAGAAPPGRDAALACTNAAQVVLDVTIPDNTIMRAGASFTKTWRLRNTGTCTWSTSYKLVRDSGAALGGPGSVKLPTAVKPNSTVDISAPLVAPSTPGVYTGYWQLADASGRRFGPKLDVVIVVPSRPGSGEIPSTLTVFYGGGDGFACPERAAASRQPEVTVQTGEDPWPRHATVCIYGMSSYTPVTVTARGPDGSKHSAPFYVGAPASPSETQGAPVLILLHWPDNLPNGRWVIAADAGRLHAETTALLRDDPVDGREVRIVPLSAFNLFDTVMAGPQDRTHSYGTGDQIEFRGYRYPANAQLPLAIYRDEDGATPDGGIRSALVDSLWVTTDAAGNFRQTYQISSGSRPGGYRAMAGRPDANGQVSGMDGSTSPFYVRASPDSPLPKVDAVQEYPDGVVVLASNHGRVSTRGGSITVSSPDVADLTILEAGVPVLPAGYANCAIADPHAWVLGPRTPCKKVLQNGTNCKQTVGLTYPMAEAWYKPWPANQMNVLKVGMTPKPGVQQVRLYVRTAMLAGPSGCRIEIAPASDEADGTDQQGFPVEVITVPVP